MQRDVGFSDQSKPAGAGFLLLSGSLFTLNMPVRTHCNDDEASGADQRRTKHTTTWMASAIFNPHLRCYGDSWLTHHFPT